MSVTILGIKLSQRSENAAKFQNILTNYGCSIRTRIGLHKIGPFECSDDGIILLEIIDEKAVGLLEKELLEIDNITVGRMEF